MNVEHRFTACCAIVALLASAHIDSAQRVFKARLQTALSYSVPLTRTRLFSLLHDAFVFLGFQLLPFTPFYTSLLTLRISELYQHGRFCHERAKALDLGANW